MVSLYFDALHASRTKSARRAHKAHSYNWRLISALVLNAIVWVVGIWIAVTHIH
jgi:hypothetical protein